MQRMNKPTKGQVIAARAASGLSGQKASELIGQESRAWRKYEAGDSEMHPASWELFLLKTHQHPTLKLVAQQQ